MNGKLTDTALALVIGAIVMTSTVLSIVMHIPA